MKIAIVGSRSVRIEDFGAYISENDEIVSGGAMGIDSCAAEYAKRNGLGLTVFLPEYDRYGKAAPIVRNKEIVDYADKVVAFWDGRSRGTLSVIRYAEKIGKPCDIILCRPSDL
ncbi:MAG: hypothetical protein IKJ07_09720 [Clostridia bacterium]|nr:hypothetical protein [Clostridia bacterium]